MHRLSQGAGCPKQAALGPSFSREEPLPGALGRLGRGGAGRRAAAMRASRGHAPDALSRQATNRTGSRPSLPELAIPPEPELSMPTRRDFGTMLPRSPLAAMAATSSFRDFVRPPAFARAAAACERRPPYH